jgi:hypothetical protein
MIDDVLIPSEVIDLLRDGLRSQIAKAAQDIANTDGLLSAAEHSERYTEPLRRIDALRAVMEEVGWDRAEPQSDLRLDPLTHGWALSALLADEVSSHAAMLRDPANDEQRDELTRDIRALTVIALDLLLRLQAKLLCPARLERRCRDETYAGPL